MLDRIATHSLMLLLAVSGVASAQTLGEIAGFVRDASGARLAGASITVTNEATNQSRTATTGGIGGYVVPLLPPGQYSISAALAGFRTETASGLQVGLGEQVRASFELQVGDVEETLDVVAGRSLVTSENASLGTTLDQEQLVSLPTLDRNYLSLVRSSSRVATDMTTSALSGGRQGGERAEQAIAVAGQRQQFNRYTLDGIENTDVNFNTYIVRPSIDAIRQVKIQTGIYSAEYGRSVSQIIVGTKSGTNHFHGSVFAFHRNDGLTAKPWRISEELDPATTNQFGFTLGGPIVRNRVFFFSNLESIRDRLNNGRAAFVPDNTLRAGDFSGRAQIFDPATRVFEGSGPGLRAVSAEPFPNQLIPEARKNPAALALLEFYPEPTRSEAGLPNYFRATKRSLETEQFLQRIDLQEGAGSSWSVRFNRGDERFLEPSTFAPSARRIDTETQQWAASNTRSIGPRMLMEARLGYSRFNNHVVAPFAFKRDVVSELGINGLASPDPSAWGVPQVQIDGWAPFGGSGQVWSNRNRIFQAIGNVSMIRGGHSLKLGGEFRRDHYNQIAAHFATGSFSFNGLATSDPADSGEAGDSFADFLIGKPFRSTRIAAFYDARLRASSAAFYLQDTWRVTSRLTLDLGLRYEYTAPFHEAGRNIINTQLFDAGAGPDGLQPETRTPILTRPGDGDFYEGINFRYADVIPIQAGDQFMSRRLVADDRNDWAPRVGVAFNPSGGWTLRAGAGVFYSQDIGNPRFEMSRQLSGRDSIQTNQQTINSDLLDPWAASRTTASCEGWDGLCLARPFTFNNMFGRRTPYIMQWMFDVQRQVTESVMLQAGYHGSGGHKLERMRQFNQSVSRSGPDDARGPTQRRPWSEYGPVQFVDSVANSNYHALDLRLQSRFTSGSTFLVGYTWSKAIDDASAIRNAGGDPLYPQNNYDLRTERGLSQFHMGQRLSVSFVYALPVGPGRAIPTRRGWISGVLGGWQIGTVLQVVDGSPSNAGNIRTANGSQRPDATGIDPVVKNPTPARFWRIEAFDTENPELHYRFGNLARSNLINPGLVNWDFSLLKNVTFRESQRLQLRFEAYNFANHPNWTNVNPSLTPATFGVVGSARDMRRIQFGVKYLF